EDRQGRVAPNQYWALNLLIGPVPPTWGPETWEKSLHSDHPAQILATLCWLGGHHLAPDHRNREAYHESFANSRLVADVRARPAVRTRMSELRQSPNKWIAEAAAAALTVKDEDH